jgi:phosphate transport system protein
MKELKTILQDALVDTSSLQSDFINPHFCTNLKKQLNEEELMTHLETELKILKQEMISMWTLVSVQLKKSLEALIKNDKDLAREVISYEKRVNSFELKIDRDCENIFALYNPVAIDLRFVLAVLKINNNVERIGDIADGIAKFIVNNVEDFDRDLLDKSRIIEMFEEACDLVDDVLKAFIEENTSMARKIFRRDELLDEINLSANLAISEYIRDHSHNVEQGLYVLSTIRKLERVGDQSKNIAEEIIFYIEAKVLKHIPKSQKSQE